MIKLSVNDTKWSSLLARTRALILYISIWIFDFGPVKLPGPSRNGPQSGWLRRFGSLHPNPHSWIFTSLTVDSSSLSYLFTSATVRIPVHTTSNCGTEAIRYVTLQFSRSARGGSFALLQYKSRTNHRPYVWREVLYIRYHFRAGRNS